MAAADPAPEALPRRYARLTLLGAAPVALLLLWLGVREYSNAHAEALAAQGEAALSRRAQVEAVVGVARDHVTAMRRVAEARLAAGDAPAVAPDGPAARAFAAAAAADTEGAVLDLLPGESSGGMFANVAAFAAGRAVGDAEVATALDLFPLQAAARERLPDLRWSYYFSDRRDFVAISPQASAEAILGPTAGRVAVLGGLFDYAVYTGVAPAANPAREARWSPVYLDAGGAGPMTSLTAPVYAAAPGEAATFRGMVGTDLLVTSLAELLRGPHPVPGVFALEDQSGHVVADTLATPPDGHVVTLAARLGITAPVVPGAATAPARSVGEVPSFDRVGDHHVAVLPMRAVPWRLVHAVPEGEVRAVALRRSLPYLALLGALAATVALRHTLMERGFVRPALALVALIRARAAGHAAAPPASLPAHWRPAAEQVVRAFDEQASLVRRLTEAEALKSGVIAAALDAVITTDRDLRVIAFNPAAERLFGHREADTLGRTVGALIVPDHMRAAHEAGLRRYHRTRVPHVLGRRVEVEARHASGLVFPVELAITAVEVGGTLRFAAYLRDLRPLRDAEAEVARQRERLHQSEKMGALGSLLAGVAHELNNPLSVVVAQAALLEETAPEGRSRERAAKIAAAARRCGRIVKTFLAMARQQPPSRGPVDLNEALRGALELAAYGLRSEGVAVEASLSQDLPVLEADADQLVQVAVNLVVNAQQALSGRPDPRRLVVRSEPDGAGGALVVVEDNGPGVPLALQGRVFEPYFTTKPLGAGTGVGLAVCRRIVEAHGGTLELDDSPALGGARFTVRLPGPQGDETAPGAADDAAAGVRAGWPGAAPGAVRRALVVDDEAEGSEVLAEVLAGHGVASDLAASPTEAIALIARHGGPAYDAVFCDLRMPGGGGAAVWREAVARWPRLRGRFVFVTGDTVAGPSAVVALDASAPPPLLERPYTPADVGAVLAKLGVTEEASRAAPAHPAK